MFAVTPPKKNNAQMSSVKSFEDALSEPLIPKPIRRIAEFNRWLIALRITVGYVACVLASGVLSSWPTIAALFVENGVLAHDCQGSPVGRCPAQDNRISMIYNVSSGVSVASVIILGQIFDAAGPKLTAAIGAFFVAVGGIGTWAAIVCDANVWILTATLTLMQLAGFINSFALLGFVFHVTKYQAFIIG
jgi:hypothetical protein